MDFSHFVNSNAVSAGQPSSWGLPAAAGKSPLGSADRVLNVCHVGGVLRAVSWVNGAWAIGVMQGAKTPTAWLLQAAFVISAAVPCLLLWLALACFSVFYIIGELKILPLKPLSVGVRVLHSPLYGFQLEWDVL